MAFDWGKLLDFGKNVVLPLGTAYAGAKAAGKAADAQQQGAREAAGISDRQYQQTRADLTPWRQAGQQAVGLYADLNTPGKVDPGTVDNYLRNLPGYGFAQREGERAWERRYSSRSSGAGGHNNSQAGKALLRWNSDRLAGPAYNQWMNRLGALSDAGRGVNQSLAGYGQNNANILGNLAMNSANAGASGDIGRSAAWTDAAQRVFENVRPDPFRQAYTNYIHSLTA